MNPQIQQQIIDNIQTLPSFQLQEILDFVMFLRDKSKPFLPDAGKIKGLQGLRGKYRHDLSSSEVFAQRKLEEIAKEEAKWQRQSM